MINSARRRSGFTLIELMVVIAISAIVAAITLGAYSEVRAGNQRTSCQSNLTQIYQAARQYAADEGGVFPPYQPGTPNPNIGLWNLYTYPFSGNVNVPAPVSKLQDPDGNLANSTVNYPIGRYLHNLKALHCPSDVLHDNAYSDAGRTTFNLAYASYQINDPRSAVPTYQPQRNNVPGSADFKRQLQPYYGTRPYLVPPASDTVVLWCPWHRQGAGGRDYDNVLFYDGSVQLLPRQQTLDPGDTRCPGPPYNGCTLTDWHRVPRPLP